MRKRERDKFEAFYIRHRPNIVKRKYWIILVLILNYNLNILIKTIKIKKIKTINKINKMSYDIENNLFR